MCWGNAILFLPCEVRYINGSPFHTLLFVFFLSNNTRINVILFGVISFKQSADFECFQWSLTTRLNRKTQASRTNKSPENTHCTPVGSRYMDTVYTDVYKIIMSDWELRQLSVTHSSRPGHCSPRSFNLWGVNACRFYSHLSPGMWRGLLLRLQVNVHHLSRSNT